MPYINPFRRAEILTKVLKPSGVIHQIQIEEIETAGELNYAITELLIAYTKTHKTYQGINDVVGALEGAKSEFYRRVAQPYEDEKCLENGDVYPKKT